ncbi:hypothetical protein ACOJD2_000924 [Campylobacter coli]
MSKEIQEFIEKLKDWKNNFSIQDYDYTKYNCEVADIAKWQKENNVNELINFWNEKIKEDYFELKHPIYNDVITRATDNYFDKNVLNIIFMTDRNNKNPWIFAQCFRSVNLVICQQAVFSIFEDNPGYNNNIMHTIQKLVNEYAFNYNISKKFAILLSNTRPTHFFYMLLCYVISINFLNIKIPYQKCFFYSKKNKISKSSNNRVFIFPTVMPLPINHFLNLNVSNFVLQESLEDYDTLVEKDNLTQEYDLTIWLGLPGERRAWLEQIQGTANILKHLNKYFKKIKVYIDGITAYDGERQDFPENKILFNKVVNATKELLQKKYNNISINTNSYNNIYSINSKDYHEREYIPNSNTSILDFDELKELEFQSQDNTYDNHINALEKLSEIKSKEKLIVFKSLAGYDYRTKICYCNDCDIAISDSGTTALVPFNFHKKPGVVFYGDISLTWIHYSQALIQNDFQKLFNKNLMKQTNRKSPFIWDYHIPSEHIYNLAAEVLEELSIAGKLKIKNLKMHRLDVPPVELVAKQYELEQKLGIKLSIENVALYNELEKQISTLALHNNISLNKALENINTNNTLNSTLQHSLQSKEQIIQNLDNKIKNIEFKLHFKTAKERIQNHLSYKLGQAMIINSKSILGYIRMPFVLSYIKDKHKQEQKIYQEKIKKDPSLKLPPLESYPGYKEALKEKECFTYKLGEALIRANNNWYGGGVYQIVV